MGCGSVSKDTTKTKRSHQANFEEIPPKENTNPQNNENIKKEDEQQKQAIKFDIEFDEEAVRQQKLKKLYLMQKKKKQEQAELERKKLLVLEEKDKNQESKEIKQVHAKKRLPPLKKFQQKKPNTASTDIENEPKELKIINEEND